MEQALEARARTAGPDATGSNSVESLVRLLTDNVDQDVALEAPAPAPGAADQRSSLDRRRAA